jgi:hypothetical protein
METSVELHSISLLQAVPRVQHIFMAIVLIQIRSDINWFDLDPEDQNADHRASAPNGGKSITLQSFSTSTLATSSFFYYK